LFVPRLEQLEDRTVPSTLTVLNNFDSGSGSLRDAIAHAKSGDTIQFAPSLNGQTITLTSDELAIKNSLDIEGPGADKLTISGNNTFRVFDIVNQGLTVTIAGLTITHGRYVAGLKNGEGLAGGGIANGSSTLTVSNDVLSYNVGAPHGGAIANSVGGVLTAINSTFVSNHAIGTDPTEHVEGGAIWNSDRGSAATVIGCTFLSNQAIGADGGVSTGGYNSIIGLAGGGAIHNEGFTGQPSTLTVENSTFIGNQAIAGNGASTSSGANSYFPDDATGGAITNHDGGILVVDGSTFAYNQAVGGSNAAGNSTGFGYVGMGVGGGVENEGTATVTNSTFLGNAALGGNGNSGGSGALLNGVGRGGGIGSNQFSSAVSLTVSNCAFTNNKAAGGASNSGGVFVGNGMGGGVENFRGSTATIEGSTFSGNQAIGGAGGAGQKGGDGLGAGIDNLLGATLTISNSTFNGNQAMGGAGGAGANGGNGFGGGIFNDGLSVAPGNAGTPATLEVRGCTITDNQATGGAAGSGGSAGLGEGGGLYLKASGKVCLDAFTVAHVTHNHASTSDDDIFGVFTNCS
jgi:hypothetical protein